MKMKLILTFFFVFVSVFLMIQSLCISAELIDPSRTLKNHQKPMGRLSVVSEPPGLDVFLDQSNICKTPIFSVEIISGTHSLRVKDTETEIYILPNKPLRLSLFKGTFIEVKKKEKEATLKTEEGTKEKNPARPTQENTRYQPEYDPAYWPLKPGGPIK